MNRIVLILVCLFPWTQTPAFAAEAEAGLDRTQQEQILAEAQAEYDSGAALLRSDPESADARFRESAKRFQILVDDGIINPDLFYNLGNAYFQAGDLGQAIANYLRASSLAPDDPRVEANLSYARTLVRPQVSAEGSDELLQRLTFWHSNWPVQWRLIIFGTAWSLLWVAVLIRLWVRYAGFRWLAGIAATASIAFGISTILTVSGDDRHLQGVLIKDEVVVRKGNAESYSPQFEEPVNQGLEFRVLEERPDWLHIELHNGESGWIPRSDAEVISRELAGNEMAIS